MKISVQTGGPEEAYGVDGGYRAIKEAGFDAVDANIDHLYSGKDIRNKIKAEAFTGSDKEIIERFKPWKDAAKKYGLDNYQAHASFPSLIPSHEDEFNDYMVEVLEKTIMGCDSMDCHNLIVHPFFFGNQDRLDPETEWNVNIDRYSRLIPAAKKYGVTICLENMFYGYKGKMFSACCSDIATACKYIDTLNGIAGEECFGFCLDTGHLLLLGLDVKESMIALGNRIKAFHVHDNNGVNDQHLAPYMGIMNWDRFVEGLKAIKFDRTMSFETYNIFNVVDPELCPDMLRFIAKTGRMFARKAAE